MLALLLAFSLAALPSVAWAAPTEAAVEGGAVDAVADLSVTFDRPSYGAGDAIVVTATARSVIPVSAYDVNLTLSIPAGYTVQEGSLTAHADELRPGGTLQAQATVVKQGTAPSGMTSATKASATPSTLVKTGDSTMLAALIAIIAVLAMFAVAAVSYARLRGHAAPSTGESLSARRRASKQGNSALCILLSVALALGFVPIAPQQADASEDATVPDIFPVTMQTTSAVAVGDTNFEAEATLSINGMEHVEDVEYATVSTDSSVATGASFAHVTLDSDIPFASDISADDLVLGAAFAGCAVKGVRADGTALSLALEGRIAEGTYGTVSILQGGFEDPNAEGFVSVGVRDADAVIAKADTAQGQGYVDGLFVLPIELEHGEFTDDPPASAFTVPNNAGIVAERAQTLDRSTVTVAFRVAGDGAEAQFRALDEALTANGIAIAAEATNCGALTAVSDEVRRAQTYSSDDYAWTTTALEYVDSTSMAEVSVADHAIVENGGIRIDCSIDLHALEGSVRIESLSAVAFDDCGADGAEAGSCYIDDGSLRLLDGDSLALSIVIPADVVQAYAALEDGEDTALTDGERNAVVETALSHVLGHDLALRGSFYNAWGIPESIVHVQLVEPETVSLVYEGLTADSNGAAAGVAFSSELNARNESSPTETAAQSFEGISKTMETMGRFFEACEKFESSAAGSGSPFGAVGSAFVFMGNLFGLVGYFTGITEGQTYTLKDVMEELSSMNETLKNIDTNVQALGIQLSAVESRMLYHDDAQNLANCIAVSGQYKDAISTVFSGIDSFPDLSNATKKFSELPQADQAKVKGLATSVRLTAKNNGMTTLELATKFGNLLSGGGTTANAGSVVDEYFNALNTYYNWENATLTARETYLRTLEAYFILAYVAAEVDFHMQYIETGGPSSSDQNGTVELTPEQLSIVSSEKALRQIAQQAFSTVEGTYDDNGTLQESATMQRLKASKNGSVLNLVDNRVYTASSFSNSIYPSSLNTYFPHSLGDLGNNLGNNSATALSTWQEMAKRQQALSLSNASYQSANVTCLKDELKLWGLLPGSYSIPSDYKKSEWHHPEYHVVTIDQRDNTSIYLAGEIKKNEGGADYSSVYHRHSWSADVFDISTNTESTHYGVLWGKTKYSWGKWNTQYYLHSVLKTQ